jgi:hypothetical protein
MAYYCSTACSVSLDHHPPWELELTSIKAADWKHHRTMCKENLKVTREVDERALANPRRSLLEKKLKTFITDVGLAEIDFATYCAFHIVHPSLPSIERTHILCLKVEVDSLKSNNPLREQIRFVEYRVMDEREFPRAYPTRMDSLIDVRFRVALSGCWKGDASASLPGAEVLEVCIINTFGTTKLPQASTREYEAVIADWFPFLQKSMESPPLSFRHLFDANVDEATLSFYFGERAEQEAGLPSRNSPLYRQSRDAMFRSDQRARNMKRQEQSIPCEHTILYTSGPILTSWE